jgi:hypothetical protein
MLHPFHHQDTKGTRESLGYQIVVRRPHRQLKDLDESFSDDAVDHWLKLQGHSDTRTSPRKDETLQEAKAQVKNTPSSQKNAPVQC